MLTWIGAESLHIPDGFLSTPVWAFLDVGAVPAVGYYVRRTRQGLDPAKVPLLGVLGSFVFAAQMINFPVAGGTSGHLIGAALAAIILGPWAAILVMTAVVGLQALMFQDGGLVVLGINLINMSIVGVLAGYGAYRLARKIGSSFRHILFVGGFVGAWVSVMIAAVLAAFELALSGTSPLSVALPALSGVHALIGIGEGLITVFALSFIRAARPELLQVRTRTHSQLAEGV